MYTDPDRNPHLPQEHWHVGNGTTDWSIAHTPHSSLRANVNALTGVSIVSRLCTVGLGLSVLLIPVIYIFYI